MEKNVRDKRAWRLADVSHNGVALISAAVLLLLEFVPGFAIEPLDDGAPDMLAVSELLAHFLHVQFNVAGCIAGAIVFILIGLVLGPTVCRIVAFGMSVVLLVETLLVMYCSSKIVLNPLLGNQTQDVPYMQLGPASWLVLGVTLILVISSFAAAFDRN